MNDTIKKYVLPNLPYLPLFWIFDKLGEAYRFSRGGDVLDRLMAALLGLSELGGRPFPSLHPADLLWGLCGAAAVWLAVFFKKKNAKTYRHKEEYGSARFGGPEDIKPFADPKPENNVILTATESLTMSSRPKNPKYARNKNVLIIGGSGSGKTRFWLKPNLLQCNSKAYPVSFVVTDPKGSVLVECGNALVKNQYQIRVFNTINFKKSMHYNPFAYARHEVA